MAVGLAGAGAAVEPGTAVFAAAAEEVVAAPVPGIVGFVSVPEEFVAVAEAAAVIQVLLRLQHSLRVGFAVGFEAVSVLAVAGVFAELLGRMFV